MNNAFSWDVTPCGPCKDSHFGGIYRLQHRCGKKSEPETTSTVISNSTLMMEAIRSSVMSVLIKATRPHISEDGNSS
jgi:hypothetical protein